MSRIDPGPLGWLAVLGAASVLPPQVLIAADYLTLEDAQRALFPQAERFVEVALALSPAQRERVAALAGAQPPHRSLRAFRAVRGEQPLGYVFIDEVIGKQDFITYAAAIGPLEVLSYRESHGGEVRSEAWRRQFAGRADLDALKVQTDIKNIAGATLSCEHVTQGVRWLVALWQVALRSPTAG
jgi:hypothetical protein